jgi:flagellar assembly protein FliH
MGRVIKASERAARTRGKARGQSAVEELVAAQTAVAEIHRRAQNQVIDLALDVARRIVGKAIELDPGLLDALYEQALDAAKPLGADQARIAVHPEDRKSSTVDQLAPARGFQVVSDPAVGRAGCRIRAGGAEIDATLEAALRAMSRAMGGETASE